MSEDKKKTTAKKTTTPKKEVSKKESKLEEYKRLYPKADVQEVNGRIVIKN